MFQLNKVYKFNTLSPMFLGSHIQHAKCIVTGARLSTARKFEPVDQKWASIYPTLPPGVANDPSACTWLVFEGQNGDEFVMADVWIDENSIQVVEHVQHVVTFPVSSVEDLPKIRAALNAAGFSGLYAVSTTDLTAT